MTCIYLQRHRETEQPDVLLCRHPRSASGECNEDCPLEAPYTTEDLLADIGDKKYHERRDNG